MELLTVSRELELATHLSAEEIRRELAVHLYSQGKLSAGKACELAGMGVLEFQCLLGSRGIGVNYNEDDLRDDLATITQLHLDQ